VTKVHALLTELASSLSANRIAGAPAEARDLLAALCNSSRFWPGAHPDEVVDDETVRRARDAVRIRGRGAPFAYAVGRSAFRHLTLEVDETVLIPRQETEQLVELVLEARGKIHGGTAADIGTGSGAIALSLATEGKFEHIIATDVSRDAVHLARRNAAHCDEASRSTLEFRVGAALSPLAPDIVDVLVCNPPYVAFGEARELPASVRDWEPASALFSGSDGLAVTRDIIQAAPPRLRAGGTIAFEVDTRRAAQVVAMLSSQNAFRDVRVRTDLAGRDRFVLAARC
jgi:release factor glutamine methyltransferase